MYNIFIPKRIAVIIVFIFPLFLIVSCDTTETNNGTLSLSFSSGSSSQKVTADTLTLETVKILLRDVKIKQQSGDDSLDIELGPFVVSLNLEGMTTDFAVGDIPPGSYDRVRFRVHKLGGSETPPDPEFRDSSDGSRYSVIVKGNINSIPFIYKSRESADQDLPLVTPLEIGKNESANLTITVDPYSWFYNMGILLDPTDPANESDIDNNIENSFEKCFEDNNHDGLVDWFSTYS